MMPSKNAVAAAILAALMVTGCSPSISAAGGEEIERAVDEANAQKDAAQNLSTSAT